MSSTQGQPTAQRERLLNMIQGGSGETEDYIEIVHYITPEGTPNGVGYREHSFRSHYRTGKPYETLFEYCSLEHLELLRELSAKWAKTKTEYSPLPVRDLGTTETGAPKDGEIRYIGL